MAVCASAQPGFAAIARLAWTLPPEDAFGLGRQFLWRALGQEDREGCQEYGGDHRA